MQHKAFSLIEAKADDDTGTFEALVAVFNNVDQAGDRIVPGAFTKTLHQWEQSGDPIPVILSHQWNDIFAHIGVVEKAEETPRGLFVKGRLDIEDNDVARQVHKLMGRRSLKEFSFGYRVPKGGQKRAKDGANELLEIEMVEVGPTLKGMNPATELHAVKSALGVKDEPKDAETLRKEAERVAREHEESQLPELDPAPPAKADAVPAPNLAKELEDLKERLAQTERALEDLRKADVTDKEPVARSVDPLRRQADTVAEWFATDGLPRKSPTPTVKQPTPELVPLDELKRRMRDEMLTHLSGEDIT